MPLLTKSFALIVVQTLMLASCGFLSHQNTMPLIHSASPSQKDQSFASQANDQKVKHSLFQRPANNVLSRHRRSVANVQTMGLFGLGAPEIAIILAAGAFVIGPEALGNMLGSAAGNLKNEYGDLPNELKKIPEEFQKGFEESTENAKARNAKQMEVLPDEDLKKYIDRNP